jgi:branched-chain amino acid transport system substrate-binding protein
MQPDEECQETKEQTVLGGKPVSRRQFLKYAGVAGAAVAASGTLGSLVAACGKEGTSVEVGAEPPKKDTFVIGGARPISGIYALFEAAHFGPAYKMWVDDMNAAGGINVGGKKLKVELKVYDDESNLDNCTRLLTKLMEDDKVDWVLGPQSTAFLFAGAGIAQAHGYIMCSAEGGATTLESEMAKGQLPLFFQFLNYSNHYQIPVQVDIFKEVGAKTVSIAYLDDLHGIEYNGQAQVFFPSPVPQFIKDVSSVVNKWVQEKPDVVLSYQYPDESILTLMTMIGMNYSPKAFVGGPGCATQAIYNIFEGKADGIMFEGAWTPKQSPAVKDFYDKLVTFVGDKANVDFWGPLIYRSELQFIQQCIEKAGTLNHEAIAKQLRTAHFPTLMTDDMFMTNQILDRSCYAGQLGQWQNGFPQVIDPAPKRTAKEIWYPKPTWTEAATKSTTSTT